MAPAVGIDLGTTYSCVAAFFNGKIKIIPNEQGKSTTPSYVGFKNDKRLIGDAAKNQAAMNAQNTIYDSKRLIGRKYDDPAIKSDLANWSFVVTQDVDNNPKINVDFDGEHLELFPEQVSSMILENLKLSAERFLREKVTQAVITVPAYFSQEQREATKTAGEIAGLEVLQILNEPTAAALAYGQEQQKQGMQVVLIFDLGGGTFDVSIIKIGNADTFEIKAVAGNNHLGGEDFDNVLVDFFAEEFKRLHDVDLKTNPRALCRLRTAVEAAKRTLSSTKEATIEIDSLCDGQDFCSSITCNRFELLCMDLFAKTMQPIKKALTDAKMKKEDIDEVILVGGSTRIPKIQKIIADFFGETKINLTVNPDESVAAGAAIIAAKLSGIECGQLQNVKLFDVVPLSLGISVGKEGEMSTVIKRNTKIPCNAAKPFSTLYNNQLEVNIKAYEGERRLADDNNFLGEFKLTGITPAPRGVTEVLVIFNVDIDGILKITANEIGRLTVFKELTIDKQNNRLTKAEVNRMLEEASKFAKLDEAHQLRLSARYALEDYVMTCQQGILDAQLSKGLTDPDRQKIREKCTEELKFLDNKNISKIELDEHFKELTIFVNKFNWKI